MKTIGPMPPLPLHNAYYTSRRSHILAIEAAALQTNQAQDQGLDTQNQNWLPNL